MEAAKATKPSWGKWKKNPSNNTRIIWWTWSWIWKKILAPSSSRPVSSLPKKAYMGSATSKRSASKTPKLSRKTKKKRITFHSGTSTCLPTPLLAPPIPRSQENQPASPEITLLNTGWSQSPRAQLRKGLPNKSSMQSWPTPRNYTTMKAQERGSKSCN